MSGLKRSEEEETLLRDIREEKERLWVDIQVGFSSFLYVSGRSKSTHGYLTSL